MSLLALQIHLTPPPKITVVLEPGAHRPIQQALPLFADVRILREATLQYPLVNGKTTYYVCHNHTCLPPSNSLPLPKRED